MGGEPTGNKNLFIEGWLKDERVEGKNPILMEAVQEQLGVDAQEPREDDAEISPDLQQFDTSADKVIAGAQAEMERVLSQSELFVAGQDRLTKILNQLSESGEYELQEILSLKQALKDAQNSSLLDLAELIHKDPNELERMKFLLIGKAVDSVDSIIHGKQVDSIIDIDMGYNIEEAYYRAMGALGISYKTRNTGKEEGYSILSMLSITDENAGARERKVELFSEVTKGNIRRFAKGENYFLRRNENYENIFGGDGERVLTGEGEGLLTGLIEFERERIEKEVTDNNYGERNYSTTKKIRERLGSVGSGLILGSQLAGENIISPKSLELELSELERNMNILHTERFGSDKQRYLDYVKAGYVLSKMDSTDWYDTPAKIASVKQIVESLNDEELKVQLKTQIADRSPRNALDGENIALAIVGGKIIEGYGSGAFHRQVEAVNSAESDLKREIVRELVFGENRVTLFKSNDRIERPFMSNNAEKLALGPKVRERYLQNQATFTILEELMRTAQIDGDGYDWADVNVVLEKVNDIYGLESINSTDTIERILDSEMSVNQKTFLAQFIISGLMTNKIKGHEFEKQQVIRGLLKQGIVSVDDIVRTHNAVLETLSIIGGLAEPGKDMGLQFSDLLINQREDKNIRTNSNNILYGFKSYGEVVDLDDSVRVFVDDRMVNIKPYRYKDYTKAENSYYMPRERREQVQQEVKTNLDAMTGYLELRRVIDDPEGTLISNTIKNMKLPYGVGASVFNGLPPSRISEDMNWDLTAEDIATSNSFKERVNKLLEQENEFLRYLNNLSTQPSVESQPPIKKRGFGRFLKRGGTGQTSPDSQQPKPGEEIEGKQDAIKTESYAIRRGFQSFLDNFANKTFLRMVDPSTGKIGITGTGWNRIISTRNKFVVGLSEQDIANLVGEVDITTLLLQSLPTYNDRREIEMSSPAYFGTQHVDSRNKVREDIYNVTKMFDEFSGNVSGQLRDILADKLQELYKASAPKVLENKVGIEAETEKVLPATFVRQLKRIFE